MGLEHLGNIGSGGAVDQRKFGPNQEVNGHDSGTD